MRALTAPELTKVRSDGQYCTFGLVIPIPAVVLTGTIDSAPASNDSVVELVWTKATGTLTDAVPGMTCWIGTSAGAHDVGVVRVRLEPTNTELFIGETSEIEWGAGQYVTIVQEFAIWRRDMRVIDETTWYADWDVVYTDQHENPAPIVNMGIDAVIDVTDYENGGDKEILVDFDASDSFVISGSIDSYLWTAEGSSSESDMDTATPEIGFDTPGTYLITCTITTAEGGVHTGYRFVHAYDIETPPTEEFQLTRLEGSVDSGGWSAEITLFYAADVPDRARIVLFARDVYQDVEGSIGYMTGRENIVFIGWVLGSSVTIDPITNYTTFRVNGPNYWIRMIPGFPEGVEDTDYSDNGGGVPTDWTEMQDLTPAKGLWHFLHWRSTITNCVDIYLPDDSRQAARTNSATGSLWDQLIVISNQVNLSFPCCDKFGRLIIDTNLQYLPLDERAGVPVIMNLTSADYGEITIERRIVPGLYYAEISGVWFLDDNSGPMGAKAPGSTPRFMGEGEEVYAEVVMGTQEEAIEAAGLILGSKADDPAFVSVTLEMLNRMFDVVPHSYVTLTIASADTLQGIEYTTKRLVVQAVRFEYDMKAGFHSTGLECEAEGIQLPAVAILYPGEGEPPITPPVEPPDPPEPPWEPPEPPEEPGVGDAVVTTPVDVRTTADLSSVDPEWDTELS